MILTILFSFLLLQSSVQSSEEISDDDELPSFYAIKLGSGFTIFRRYYNCSFYYSYSDPSYSYFYNNQTKRWEVGTDMMIEEDCTMKYENYSEALYYRPDNDTDDGELIKIQGDDVIVIKILSLELGQSRSDLEIIEVYDEDHDHYEHRQSWKKCKELSSNRTENVERCFLLVSFVDKVRGSAWKDICKYRTLDSYSEVVIKERESHTVSTGIIQTIHCNTSTEDSHNPFLINNIDVGAQVNETKPEEDDDILVPVIAAGVAGVGLILIMIIACCQQMKCFCFEENDTTPAEELPVDNTKDSSNNSKDDEYDDNYDNDYDEDQGDYYSETVRTRKNSDDYYTVNMKSISDDADYYT